MPHLKSCPALHGGKCTCHPDIPEVPKEKHFEIVCDQDGKNLINYLIIRRGDIGHYVVARTHALGYAKLICDAFEADVLKPPPF